MKIPVSVSMDGELAQLLTVNAGNHGLNRSAHIVSILEMFTPFDAPALARFLVEHHGEQIDDLTAEIVRWEERKST